MISGDFGLLHSGNISGADTPLATIASESNIVVISGYLGVEDYGTYASLMEGWKTGAAAHGLTLHTFMYTQGQAFQYVLNSGDYPWLTDAFNKSSMWAYSSASGRALPTSLLTATPATPVNRIFRLRPTTRRHSRHRTRTTARLACWPGTTSGTFTPDISTMYSSMGWHVSKYGEVKGFAANPYLSGIYLDNYYRSRARLRPGME